MVEIARIFTFGCGNRRELIDRLMRTSEFFKGMSFWDAAQAYRYAEMNGLVSNKDGMLVVYHDPDFFDEYIKDDFQT